LPLSAIRRYSLLRPSIDTSRRWKRACTPKALPVRR
jgi:hypothetical protein